MNVFHCPDLEPLVTPLAATLAVPLSDPFASEVIVVPTLDVARYLQRELPRHLGSTGSDDGIVANVDFVYPRQIINLPAGGAFRTDRSPWDAGPLAWEIAAAIASEGLVVPGQASRILALAGRAASLFDRYATHRPQMLAKWADGQKFYVNDEPSLHWQVDLYRTVRGRLAARGHGSRAIDGLETWRGRIGTDALPERISVFGLDTMGRTVREILEALSEHLPVTVYLVHPRIGTWPEAAAPDTVRTTGHASAAHPLLARWGAQLLEAGAVVSHLHRSEISGVPRGDCLLHRLQLGVIGDAPPTTATEHPDAVWSDGTVQVHACYGRTRQAEALRDALLHIMDTHRHIRARDIAILCPNVAAAAPVLASTFAGGNGLPSLPISATSGSVTDPDPVTEAFDALLGLLTSRCSASEILDVLRLEPVARTFGIDTEALERISRWAEHLSVRFGIDGEHRARWAVPAHIVNGTWEAAVRQLMMGVAVPAETPILGPGGVVPYDGIDGSDLDTAGALAEFLGRLRACIAAVSADPDHVALGEWFDVLGRLVDGFVSVSSRDAESLGVLRGAVESLRGEALAAGLSETTTMALSDLSHLARQRLARGANSYFSRGEAITLAPLGEVRHVPFQVVCLFDANEDAFTGARLDGDDVLAREPVVGEPIYSASGRLHLLDAVLAARSHLVITCDGFDMATNREMPLPVPLGELLEVAGAHGVDTPGSVRLCASHPRHNFDAATMTPGLVLADAPFTHDHNARVALAALRANPGGATVLAPDARSGTHDIALEPIRELRQLVRLAANPVEYHYRDVLKVRLPTPPGRDDPFGTHNIDGDGVLNLTLDALAESSEGRRLLAAVASSDDGADAAIAAWGEVRAAAGALPPGALGDLTVSAVREEVTTMIAALPAHLRSLRGHDVDCDIIFNGAATTLRITEVVPGEGTRPTSFARVRYRRFADVLLAEVWTELALLTLARHGEPIEAHLVCRNEDSQDDAPTSRVLVLGGGSDKQRTASATRVLAALEGLHRSACAGPVPLFATASAALHRHGMGQAKKKLTRDLGSSPELTHVYGAFSAHDILTGPVADSDLDALGPDAPRANSRARLFAQHLWGTYDATVTAVVDGNETHGGDTADGDRDE